MTGLVITGIILLVLLFSPVILTFSYSGGRIRANVRYLFIFFDFSPEKLAKRAEKRAARGVKEEYKKQKAEEETKAKEEKAASDTAKTVWSLVKSCKKALNTLRRHLIFYRIRIMAAAGGEDAHKTGNNYAVYCVLIPNLISLLDALFVVREPKISIVPDFLLERTAWDVSFKVRIAPWFVFAAAFSFLTRVFKVILSNKQKRQKVKGGKQHEPTASYQ